MSSGIFLGLGSNMGDRQKKLRDAIALLQCEVVRQSSIYETEPVEYLNQPWFLNMVIQIETEETPFNLLRRCQSVESRLGRKRKIAKGPRTIDIDILFFHDQIWNEPELILPHPGIPQRRFVLEPLKEIAPHFIHPVSFQTIEQLLQSCPDRSEVRRFVIN